MSDFNAPTLTVPPPAPATRPLGPSLEPRSPGGDWRAQTVRWLGARGVHATALAVFGVTFGGLSALVFLVGHPGTAAILGLVALVSGELALARGRPVRGEPTALPRALAALSDLAIAAGLLAGLAAYASGVLTLLAFLAAVLLAFLPLLQAAAGPTRLPPTIGLWTRVDRYAVLLLGALLGRPGPALAAIVLVCGCDAWLRIERLTLPLGVEPAAVPAPLRHVVRTDGSFEPLARWISLGLTVLLILLLPQSASWRL